MDTHLPDYLRSKSHLDVIPFDGENENVYDPDVPPDLSSNCDVPPDLSGA